MTYSAGVTADEGLAAVSARLQHYLRALWQREPRLLSVEQPATQLRPYLSELGIHLPPRYASHRGALQRALYRAAAAHAAAHRVFSTVQFERRQLKPLQLALIGLLEDARVEQCAIDAMPGLRRLWLQFFDARIRTDSSASTVDSAEALLLRLARGLLDPHSDDDHPWVAKGRQLYQASQAAGSDPLALREVGILLGNDLGQMRVQFNARHYLVEPLYRDDNLALWDSDAPPTSTRTEDSGFQHTNQALRSAPRFDRDADAQDSFRPREVAIASDASGGDDDGVHPTYPEWDQRLGRLRPHWCRIIERSADALPCADAKPLHASLERHAALRQRLATLLQARKAGQLQRLRRQTDGDEIETDALVRMRTALRCGQAPDLHLYRRTRLQKPDLSVLLLVDLSASVNSALGSSTLLALLREASVLLADAIGLGGDRMAIHGFRSNGRHEVNYLRFKEFSQPLDGEVLGRLAAADGALSTRMGAAIRHASRLMRDCRSTQRLILVLTDGEPHDIDSFHPEALLHDAAHAVRRSAAEGTPVFCVSVDPHADAYVRRIFGTYNYLVIDQVEQLPQRLPALYLRLAA